MKNVILAFAILFSFTLTAQEIKPVMETQDNGLVKATFFHDNGQIAQTGFYKEGKPHGEWIGYDSNGKKVALGEYDTGKKIGKWFFWSNGQLSEVDYRDSRIVGVTKWSNSNSIAVNK